MNYIENNQAFAAREPNFPVRVWRSSGDPRMPLTSSWVRPDITPLRLTVPIRRAAR